ncbi:hypothetical protein KM176_11095 [Pseudooceanicola sp. CBS1P-1]|uniref:DUF2946 domain-containing protein n=1 Tax=Pseudooceanicola albus TaxID=2692189 RepID=A0A6L7G8F9_9RHOB|nr:MULTISPECIES: hypothetical protein [Pseudooceanicola]MBT9384405.1 hypothetical protein [Pseudooceanicola endophyticus]MXN19857.1 hypothetical protein [Pseudooceanicola albus]
MRYLTVLLTLALLALPFALPLQVKASGGCASQVHAPEVCHAPGMTPRAEPPAGCVAYTLPEAGPQPDLRILPMALTFPDPANTVQGRTIQPDRRPPRA